MIDECRCDVCDGECPVLVEPDDTACLACRHGRHAVLEEE